MGEGGASFPEGCDHPYIGMWGSLLAQILTLLQTTFVHLVVKQTRDRRQLIKAGAVTQSCLWALSVSIRDSLVTQIVTRGSQLTKVVLCASSLGTRGPFPPFRPWDENTVSKAFFPRQRK